MPKAKRKTAADFFEVPGTKCRHHLKYRKTCGWCDFETWGQMCIRHENAKEHFHKWRVMIGKNW